MSICIVGDFYTIVVVVKVCMLIVNNCKSLVIEKFCIVCYNNKDNHCEHADLNGDGDVDGDGIFGDNDLCPFIPETYNKFKDTDGCPDDIFNEIIIYGINYIFLIFNI